MKIEVRNICKTIKGRMVLDNVSATFESGNVYGLCGGNGSGKTMLIRAICGLIRIDSGEILIDGKRVGNEIDFPENVGVIIENPQFFKFYTGYENLASLANIRGNISKEEIDIAMRKVGLDPRDTREEGKYSLGMRQRLGIAQAIMESPKLLLLDEPTNALDDKGIKMFYDIIEEEKEKGTLIILASHVKDDIKQLVDSIYRMNEGQLTQTGE